MRAKWAEAARGALTSLWYDENSLPGDCVIVTVQPYSRVKEGIRAGHDLICIKPHVPIIRLLCMAAGSYSEAPSTSLVTMGSRRKLQSLCRGKSGL